MASLDEDTIDDILYFARANEASELSTFLTELATKTKTSQADILSAAIDPYSKNSALHYAAANGHDGILLFFIFFMRYTVDNSKRHHKTSPLHPIAYPQRYE